MALGATNIVAQSTMTDEQIMQFVIKENEKGTSQQQIVTKLIQKGVSIEHIRSARNKYEKEKKGELLGAKDLTGSAISNSRMRNNNGDNKDNFRKNGFKKEESKEEISERRRKLLNEEKQANYLNELDFILPDSLAMYEDAMFPRDNRGKKKVFGRNIFNQKNLSFEPNMNIATPQDYRLGPGDAVFIDIWGASQKTFESTISPEGTVNIEGYGPVSVAGLTVFEANSRLRNSLGERYRSSKVRLSVGQTKTITVNVMGEVQAPGTFTLSAFASVFHALYMAGGPNDIGTLRDIKVYRNNRLVTNVDVYDYILNGKLTGNVRLADNDVIVVGPYTTLVNIAGKIKRPMYYEMKPTESVATLLKYAGGFTGDAYQKNIQLIRKSGGSEYSIFSIDEFERGTFKVADGDSLTVDSVLPRFKNMVEVKGAVFRPGMYQMDGNIGTVRQLLECVGGVTEDAFLTRAVMHRRKPDRTLEVLAIDVEGLLAGKTPDIPLRNEDILFIPSKKDMQAERTLSIYGEITYPGIYQFADNTTIEDFILQAGGLKDAASLVKIDISRRIRNKKATEAGNQIARSFSLSLKDGFVIDGEPGFTLEPFDEVYVRKSPGYIEQEHVSVEGEIAFSGIYTLTKKEQRLSDLVKHAGGLTNEAYAKGARLERRLSEAEKLKQQSLLKLIAAGDSMDVRKIDFSDTRYIGINLDKALEYPGSNEWDVVLQQGDHLIIPQFNNTVSINGEVMYPNTVAFKEGADLDYYINQAGGYNMKAKKGRAFAVNMNGTVTRVKKARDIQPGCEIVIPAKPKRKGLSLAEILTLGSTTTSLASVITALITR